MARRRSVYRSKKTGVEKVETSILIDKKLFESVRKLATDVYGLDRGAFSLAVQEALEAWQLAHTKTHKSTNPRYSLRLIYNSVMQVVEELIGVVPVTIAQHTLENAISEALNIKDRRSVIGWLHRFYVAGLIKPLTVDIAKESDWKRNKAVEFVARVS